MTTLVFIYKGGLPYGVIYLSFRKVKDERENNKNDKKI
mgnify:CR=1 FL=1